MTYILYYNCMRNNKFCINLNHLEVVVVVKLNICII